MSFVNFLKQVGKLAVGYLGGAFLLIVGLIAMSFGSGISGGLVAIIGFVMLLFGVYTEKEM